MSAAVLPNEVVTVLCVFVHNVQMNVILKITVGGHSPPNGQSVPRPISTAFSHFLGYFHSHMCQE